MPQEGDEEKCEREGQRPLANSTPQERYEPSV
jgi:hypothetical protein